MLFQRLLIIQVAFLKGGVQQNQLLNIAIENRLYLFFGCEFLLYLNLSEFVEIYLLLLHEFCVYELLALY